MAVKNTGIQENQLSDFDFGHVLKDSHNKRLNALDVNVINDLVPERWAKKTYTLKDMRDGTKETEYITYYDLGVKNLTYITFPNEFQDKYEISLFDFTGQVATNLANKYITVYDITGMVVFWFNLDTLGVEPIVTGASRYIPVSISTGNTTDQLALALSNAADADSEFSGLSTSSSCVIQSVTAGNLTNATQGNTTIQVGIVDGFTLEGKYILLYSANNKQKYYIWFNKDNLFTEPSVVDAIGIEINFTTNISRTQLYETMVSTINNIDDFRVENAGDFIKIQNIGIGPTIATMDFGTTSIITTKDIGSNGQMVAKIQIYFDEYNYISGIERIV